MYNANIILSVRFVAFGMHTAQIEYSCGESTAPWRSLFVALQVLGVFLNPLTDDSFGYFAHG